MSQRPTTDEPASKAAGFSSVIAILHETVGDARFQRFVTMLPKETAALVQLTPSAVSWLPIRHFYAVCATAHAVLFDGNDDDVAEVGHRSIARDLNALYRIFVRVASVEYVLARVARLWSVYNRNHGAVSVQMRGELVAEVTYEGIPAEAPPAYWAFQRGALVAVIEATGLRNARAQIMKTPPGAKTRVIRLSADRRA